MNNSIHINIWIRRNPMHLCSVLFNMYYVWCSIYWFLCIHIHVYICLYAELTDVYIYIYIPSLSLYFCGSIHPVRHSQTHSSQMSIVKKWRIFALGNCGVELDVFAKNIKFKVLNRALVGTYCCYHLDRIQLFIETECL